VRDTRWAGLLCLSLLAACSSSSQSPDYGPYPDNHTGYDRRTEGKRLDSTSSGCNCTAGYVCSTDGSCVPEPVIQPGEIMGEVILLKQVSPMDTTILHQLGKGEASFYAQESLPHDGRETWATGEGGTCWYEIGSTYPSWYNNTSWPSGPGLGAGNLTFTVTGAAGPIVLEASNYSGWAYFHKDTPPHLTEGSTSYPDFFDPAYLPSGAAFKVDLAGGPDIAAAAVTNGVFAPDFNISIPPAEAQGAQATANADLIVQWSPPSIGGGYMEVFITSMMGDEIALLSCKIRDTGSITVPAAAMKKFYSGESLGLQLRRTSERYAKITTTGGKILHLKVLGRHARLGRFTLQ
jgi:hypothetical protein